MNIKKTFLSLVLFSVVLSEIVFSQTPVADSLVAVIQKLPADTSRLNAMYDLSREFVINGENETAFRKIAEFDSFIERLSSQSNNDKAIQNKLKSEKARSLNLKGVIYSRKADFKKALEYYQQALVIRQEMNDAQGIAMTCNNLSGLYSNLGDEANKLKYLELAIKNFEAAGDKTGLGQAYYNQSYYYFQNSDYKTAIELNLKSQKLAEEIDDKIGVTHSIILTGDIYRKMGNLKVSTGYFMKALEISKETGDVATTIYAYDQLAVNYEEIRDFKSSYNYHLKAIQLSEEVDDKRNAANAYGNLAFLFDAMREDYVKKGEHVQAAATLDSCIKYTFIAKQLYEETGIKDGLPLILLRCGIISLEQKKFSEAHKYFVQTIELAEELGNKDNRMWAYKYFSDLYAMTNENEKALTYYRMYSNLKDSVLNESNSKTIGELNTRFETEKKEQQIKLLLKENDVKTANELRANQIRNLSIAGIIVLIIFGGFSYYGYVQRKKLSEQLTDSLNKLKSTQQQLIETEKQRTQENVRLRISRDIHDEIGSSLTKIALLSEMVVEESTESSLEAKESLQRIATYSRNVNSTLSEIVWAVNPQQDTLERTLSYMRYYTHGFLENTGINEKINFPEHPENRVLNPDMKRNLFLVLKESLNNAMKYSHAKNISVTFVSKKNDFEFSIKDDGIGFAPLSDQSPPEPAEGGLRLNGNGLNNMEYRMKQSDCSLNIKSSVGNGCEVVVTGKLS